MGSWSQNNLNAAKELYAEGDYLAVLKRLNHYDFYDDVESLEAVKLMCLAKVNSILETNGPPEELEAILNRAISMPQEIAFKCEAFLLYCALEMLKNFIHAKKEFRLKKVKRFFGIILWVALKMLKVVVNIPEKTNKGALVFVDIVNSEYDKYQSKKVPLAHNSNSLSATVKYIKEDLPVHIKSDIVREAFEKDLQASKNASNLIDLLEGLNVEVKS